jgi:hypothetical protein
VCTHLCLSCWGGGGWGAENCNKGPRVPTVDDASDDSLYKSRISVNNKQPIEGRPTLGQYIWFRRLEVPHTLFNWRLANFKAFMQPWKFKMIIIGLYFWRASDATGDALYQRRCESSKLAGPKKNRLRDPRRYRHMPNPTSQVLFGVSQVRHWPARPPKQLHFVLKSVFGRMHLFCEGGRGYLLALFCALMVH